MRSPAHLSAKQSSRIQTGLVPKTCSYSKINHYRKPSILFEWLIGSHESLQLHKLRPSPLTILTTEPQLGSLIQQQFQACFMLWWNRKIPSTWYVCVKVSHHQKTSPSGKSFLFLSLSVSLNPSISLCLFHLFPPYFSQVFHLLSGNFFLCGDSKMASSFRLLTFYQPRNFVGRKCCFHGSSCLGLMVYAHWLKLGHVLSLNQSLWLTDQMQIMAHPWNGQREVICHTQNHGLRMKEGWFFRGKSSAIIKRSEHRSQTDGEKSSVLVVPVPTSSELVEIQILKPHRDLVN